MRRATVVGVLLGVIGFALAAAPEGRLDFYFRERMLLTWVSALLLLTTGVLLLRAARARERTTGSGLFWEILGWGFVYLAFDEHFQYHERLGSLAEGHLGSISWVNHLDDLVIVTYGLALLTLCFLNRREIRALWSGWLPPVLAVSGLLLTTGIDAFSPDTPPYRALEESLKLLAVAGFFLWAYEARSLAERMSTRARSAPVDPSAAGAAV